MASLIVEIADAVVAALNGESAFSPALNAQRHYRPEFDLAELKQLRVSVVPRRIALDGASRSALQRDIAVDVAVQKKVDADKREDIDALMALVEHIAESLRNKRLALPGGDSAAWVKTENDPIYSPEHLQQKQVFTSVMTVTFRVVR